ncbi:MAG: preprotein translocase subunit SecA, partial [Chitinophagales bacterium]
MLGFVTKTIEAIFGKKSDKDLKALDPYVDKVHQAHERIAPLSNDELRGKTQEFRQNLKAHLADIDTEIQTLKDKAVGENKLSSNQREDLYFNIDKLEKERNKQLEQFLDQILPEAFAVVKETAKRFKENDFVPATANDLDRNLAVNAPHITITNDQVSYATEWMAAGGKVEWNMVHYDVQLIGGVVLHQGKIAEMATGEGKTLVATLPAYLNGLTGEGVHVITVNNYLARRDCEWMAPLLNFLGLTVDCIDRYKPHSAKRLKAYRADITYGTNNEFGFDYLRDNMVRNPEEIVQRKLHYTMIDEVDSVLIDDARTPLIISGPVERGEEQEFDSLKPRIERLVKVQRELTRKYLVEAKKAFAEGNTKPEEGGGGLALLRASRGLPRNKPLIKFLGESGNKTVLLDTENYYLQEQAKRMPEVDKELYFVIEEKNNQVHLTERGVELITKSGEDAGFFIMPDVGGEIAKLENNTELSPEELRTQKDQLMQDFAIKSERLHSVQQLLKAYTLFEMDVEYILEDGKVKIVDESTGRVMEGRRYSDGLHQAIEAKENVKVEAATQTFATVTLQNFFRMYHKLAGMTGTAETEAGEFWDIYGLDVVVIPTNKPIARADENDLVYRTTREKYNAVIDHVIALSKAGQPVLVGTTSVDTSEKLSRLLQRKGIDHNVLNAKQHAREADIVTNAGQPGAVTIATNMAGRGTDIKLGTGVIQSGGLAIVGTERHESRRVDRQLRGRAGRQGDPGSSQFFVSLEDNLMRIFGSERVAKVMDKIGFQEGEVIQHRMITKSIENAQKKVEENHFGTRKRLLDYDEVMNAQRNVIYAKRRHALYGERLSVDLSNAYHDLCEEIVIQSRSENDYEGFKLDVIRHFSTDTAIDET